MPIEKNARIFRAGTYPKKGKDGADFVVTVDDLQRIAANTESAPHIFAHKETGERLDFGTVTNLRVEGDELHGTLMMDEASAPFLEKNGLKHLSAGIPLDKSCLREVSSTRMPHIADCAWFSLESETDAAQGITDAIETIVAFAGARHNADDRANLSKLHSALVSMYPDCCPANEKGAMFSHTESDFADERKPKMSFWKRLTGKADPTPEEETAAKAEFHNAVKELVPAPADNTAQFSTMRKQLREQQAEAFADKMLYAGKLSAQGSQTLDAVRTDLIARFCEAAEDDENAPRTVTFSVGSESKTGSRVDRLKAEWESKASRVPMGEGLPDSEMAVLFNREHQHETAEAQQARGEAAYNNLRSMTPSLRNTTPSNGKQN